MTSLKKRKVFTIAKLKKRARKSQQKLRHEFPNIFHKLQDLDLDLKDLRIHSAKMISAAAIAGTLLAASPVVHSWMTPRTTQQQKPLTSDEIAHKLQTTLQLILPEKITPLSPEKENQLHTAIQETLGLNAVATLEGNHLNTSFGYIGAEQHLPRYPGDMAFEHDEFQFKGVTPGRGAWGYFAPSRSQLTEDDVLKEKYYVAVQTMYLPNWNKDFKKLRDWYKYRTVLVVNPKNGKSVVADIADAGPAAWTGKHFGGSPEVMATLELNTGMQKGAVLIFFLDDKYNEVALGPVTHTQGVFLANR